MSVGAPVVEHVRLGGDDVEVVVLPAVGARLHRLRVNGLDLLHTPDELEAHRRDPFFWGAYNMAPWCNRLDASPIEFRGRLIDLPSNFRDGTAIHGQVYDTPWLPHEDGSFTVRGGGGGWPWAYEATLGIEIDASTLRLAQSLTNVSDEQMPGGIGIHPWFRGPVEIAIRAALAYPSNIDSPARPVPVEGDLDLRRRRPMAPDLDATWAEVGEPAVELLWPQTGLRAGLSARATLADRAVGVHIVAASPGDVGAVAVEPQTHAPQGLRRLLAGEPGALAVLAPGETLRLITELSFEREAATRGSGP